MQMFIRILIASLFIVSSAIAFDEENIIIGSPVSSIYYCPTGTYTSFWDGDYDGDNDQICYDSGGSNKTGTNSGGNFSTSYGKDGSIGWRYTDDDTLTWDDSSAEDLISKTSGTIWVEFRVTTTCTGDTPIVYAPSDTTPADNYIRLHIELDTPGEIRAYYRAGGTTYRADSDAQIACNATWNTVGMSWRVHADDDIAVTIGDSWLTGTVAEDRTLVLFTGDIDSMAIGAASGQTQDIDFNRIVVLPGWQTTCPWE